MLLISITLDHEIENLRANLEKNKEQLTINLLTGNLLNFEKMLYDLVTEFYNEICSNFINTVSGHPEMKNILQQFGQKNGLGKFELRDTDLQLCTGNKIRIKSYYAKRSKTKTYKGSRHLVLTHWKCLKNASPLYYSYLSILSVLCPSFEVASSVLNIFNIKGEYNRTRELSEQFGLRCLENRVENILDKNESLAEKRVVLFVDGGRARVRENLQEHTEESSYPKYNTPWKEPKLFVIQTIDDEGKVIKNTLPIYESVLGDCNACFELLEKYLQRLEINKAIDIQFIADGATWIWSRVKPMLIQLGVKVERITETVDYYHAVEHIKELVDLLPGNMNNKKNALFTQFKQYLWDGQIKNIIETVKSVCKKISNKVLTQLTYFLKNEKRMKYAQFRDQKRLCGSGIVESAIRRVINLRFKCPSSFWNEKNLESLIFLRSAILSNRWNILTDNLMLNWHKY